MLKRYMQELHSLVEEANRERKQSGPVDPQSPPPPLDQQIVALMATLSPAQANRPWNMEELLLRLQGRYRDRPHAQQVGQALRRLGWRRERLWGSEHAGRRMWLPPR